MTLLELMSNCINFVTQDDEAVNPSTLNIFKSSTNYSAFIKNCLPEINRAIQQIVIQKKLPLQFFEFDNENESNNSEYETAYNPLVKGLNSNSRVVLELTNEQKKQVYSIFKVEIEDENGNFYSPVAYKKIGNKIIVPDIKGTIYIKYYPRVRLLTEVDKGAYEDEDTFVDDNSLDLEDVYLDDTICTDVIPYLVKANLWQEVEPELAQLERNIGLQNLMMLSDVEEEPYQTSVARTSGNKSMWG